MRMIIEAEDFRDLGGWLIDQQSMNVMGSAYVMAHGMGVPVADAVTVFALDGDKTYYAWVRTRNWTAVWGRGQAGGVFTLKVNGNELENTLGNGSTEWDWQYAGEFDGREGENTITLHDLTGFNGRCDAIYITDDPSFVPENTEEFRYDCSGVLGEDMGEFDLVVCGGGLAGICMAITAIREGLNVALIHDRPVLGGCNSSEIKVGLGGMTRSEPYPKLGNVLESVSPVFGSPGTFPDEFYEDKRKENAFLLAKWWSGGKYSLSLGERVVSLEKEGDRIVSVISKSIKTGKKRIYKARLFADCTGDAILARLGGAAVMYGREGINEYGEDLAPDTPDRMVMGMTVTWNSRVEDHAISFPDVDWGIPFDAEHHYRVFSGDWEWEAGQFRDMAEETEYIRDYSLMTIFGNWSYLKNHDKNNEAWQCRALNWVSPYGGKRESYRVVGDHVLTQNDIERHIPYEDGTASITWDIDIHYPDPINVKLFGEPFRSCAIHRGIGSHYPIPYRTLYCRDIDNLFLGGRVISTTHIAFSAVRVMRTLGVLGEVAGLAAGICKRNNCTPRQVYSEHLSELKSLMERGVTINDYHGYKPGIYEHLAFPGCNQYYTHPDMLALPLDDKEMMRHINSIGVKYMTAERFKGIEDRDELTDEEKQIAENFYRRTGKIK